MSTVFVTSSGTGIGKTFVTLKLLAELTAVGIHARAIKPVASGFDAAEPQDSDTELLLSAQGLAPTAANFALVSPWRFRAPLSPDMAARREGRTIPFTELVAFCRSPHTAQVTLIEGVGGVMAPLTAEHTVLDWITAIGAPVLLVVGSYLGTLSHSLTAAAVLEQRRARLAGVVVSESLDQPVALAETAAALAQRLPGTVVQPLSRHGVETLLPLVAAAIR